MRAGLTGQVSPGVRFPDGGAVGVVQPDGTPSVFLDGWMSDVDAGYSPPDEAFWILDERTLPILCELLASGRSIAHATPPVSFSLEEQRQEPNLGPQSRHWVWFFPMTEDWFVFRMRVDELIWGLESELRWIQPSVSGPPREMVERCLVWLDQAASRLGL